MQSENVQCDNQREHSFFLEAGAQCDEQYMPRWPTASGYSAAERTSLDRAAVSAGPDGAIVVEPNGRRCFADIGDAIASMGDV